MTQVYVYECRKCGGRKQEVRDVEDRDKPISCHGPMKRKYMPPTFVAHMQKDMVENKPYRGLDAKDTLARLKKDDARYEKMTAGWDMSPPKETSMDEILRSGVIDAHKSGNLDRWRKDHVTDAL